MKTGGRKLGTPNKTTASAKAALMAAFDGAGGVVPLVRFAKADPASFYQLWAKMLPMEAHTPAVRIEPWPDWRALIGHKSNDDYATNG